MDYSIEERLQEFIFDELRSEIDLNKMKTNLYVNKNKKKISKSKIALKKNNSFSGLTIGQIEERFEFVSGCCLMNLKTQKNLLALATKNGTENEENFVKVFDFMKESNRYMTETLLHLMLAVVAYKFDQELLSHDIWASSSDISAFASFFERIFKEKSDLYMIYNKLPKDIKATIKQCCPPCDIPLEFGSELYGVLTITNSLTYTTSTSSCFSKKKEHY